MKKYKYLEGDEEKEVALEDKDYFLTISIDNLTKEIEKLRWCYGR